MADEYTRKERETIDLAWAELVQLTETFDWSMAPMLREAFRTDRKGRGSARLTRALLIGSAANLTENTAVQLYGLAPGHITAAVVGGGIKRRDASRFLRWCVEHAAPATEAHKAAQARRMAELR